MNPEIHNKQSCIYIKFQSHPLFSDILGNIYIHPQNKIHDILNSKPKSLHNTFASNANNRKQFILHLFVLLYKSKESLLIYVLNHYFTLKSIRLAKLSSFHQKNFLEYRCTLLNPYFLQKNFVWLLLYFKMLPYVNLFRIFAFYNIVIFIFREPSMNTRTS